MFYKETATVDGNRLSYLRCGDWSSEAILFFHGFTGSKEYFPDKEIGGKRIAAAIIYSDKTETIWKIQNSR